MFGPYNYGPNESHLKNITKIMQNRIDKELEQAISASHGFWKGRESKRGANYDIPRQHLFFLNV